MPSFGASNKPAGTAQPGAQARPATPTAAAQPATSFGTTNQSVAPKPQPAAGASDGGIQIPPFLQKNKKKD